MHAALKGTVAGQSTGWVRFPVLKRITCYAPLCAGMLAACDSGTITKLPFVGYKNYPGEVRYHSATTSIVPTVAGSFQGRMGFGGGAMNVGGGCLVFQEADHVVPCKLDSGIVEGRGGPEPVAHPRRCPVRDWRTTGPDPRGAYQVVRSYGEYGYCHEETETCWYKWDDSHCVTRVALYPNEWNLGPIAAWRPNTTGAIRWRVFTCQNDDGSLCRDPDGGIRRWGKIEEYRRSDPGL
jgi:hypothetical protein